MLLRWPWLGGFLLQPLPTFSLDFLSEPLVKTEQGPDRVELTIGDRPEWSVIWLHGLGADGHDFEPVAAELGLPDSPGIRFVFPHAPYRSVTINGGMRMRAWYDIRAMDIVSRPDGEGVEASSDRLAELVEEEMARGIEPGRVVIAGFSQGGAIALHTALTRTPNVAGVIALSTYLPLAADAAAAGTGSGLPVFMGHGTFDPVVPLALGEAARRRLDEAGFDLTWRTYAMPHAVSPDEIVDIRDWLTARVAA